MDADLVDATAAILLGLHGAVGPFYVLGKQIHGQRMLALGDSVHQRVNFGIFEGHDGQQRTEKLVLYDVFVDVDGIDEGGRIAAGFLVADATKNDTVAVFVGEVGAFVVGAIGDEFGIFGIVFGMFADLLDEGLFEFLNERLGHLFRNGYLVDIDADLSGVAKFEEGNFAGSVFQVGVFADDAPVAGFATEFQSHGREVFGGFGQHMLAHRGRTRVENLIETLGQTHVRHIVTAVNQGDIFGRKDFSEELFEKCSAGR